jgi:hypothetical protein
VQCERARLEREGKRGSRAHFELVEREKALDPDRFLDPRFLTLDRFYNRWTFERGFIGHFQLAHHRIDDIWPALVRVPVTSFQLTVTRVDVLAPFGRLASHPTAKTIEVGRNGSSDELVLDAKLLRPALANAGPFECVAEEPVRDPRLALPIVSANLRRPPVSLVARAREVLLAQWPTARSAW